MHGYLSTLRRTRLIILLVWGAAIAVSASLYLMRFSIDNSVGIWFLKNDRAYESYRELNQVYGSKEWTFLLLETDSIYAPGFLRDLAAISARIQGLDNVVRVVSIANARDSELDSEDILQYTPLFRAAGEPPTSEEIEIFRRRLESNPIFANNLYQPGDDRHTALLIQNANLFHERAPYRIKLIDEVRQILADYPSIGEASLAGTTIINAELNRAAKRDMLVYYVLISLFLILSSLLFLRYTRDVLVLLAVVVGSVVSTLGLIASLGLTFNMVTIMLPTILVAMGVSVVVHLINDFHQERRHETTSAALAHTLRALLWPSFWTTATTVIGFLSLTVSAVTPLQQLGYLAAFGVAIAWVQTFVIAPILIDLLWSGQAQGHYQPSRWVRRIPHASLFVVENHPGIVIAIGLVMAAVTLTGLTRLHADTDYVRFFRADSTLRADYNRIAATDFSQYYVSLDLIYPAGRVYTHNPGFDRVLALEQELESLPQVRKVLSAAQLLREADRAMTGKRASPDELADFGSDRLGQLTLLAEASGNDDLTDLLSGDRRRTQLLIMTDYMSTQQLEAFRVEVEDVVKQLLPPDIKAVVSGTNVLWAKMDANVIETQLNSVSIVVCVLAVLLPLLFRSLTFGLIGLMVSLLPVAFVLGLMGWLGIKVNMATCLIGGIALGVAVDDTIYLLYRIRRAMAHGLDIQRNVRRGILTTGRAMAATSLILMGGFLTMALSDFLPSAHFGVLFAVTVCLALLGDLLMLPVLLRWLYRKEAKQPEPLPSEQ